MNVRRASNRDGDLLRVLEGAEQGNSKTPRGGDPAIGSTVQLWRLDGDWKVWSNGPSAGTWWLIADDDTAQRLAEQLASMPVRGTPVVLNVWKTSIAVKTQAIRPPVLKRRTR